MKKTALKEAIKSKIKSILSEGTTDEERENQNVGLAHIKSSGENDGGRAMMSHLKHNDFKNAPDMETYTDGFVKGASNSADYLKSKLGQAIRGGGDEESLMGLVGLNEISSTEANAQLMEIEEHQKDILLTLNELKKGDAVFAIKGADLNAAIKLITNEVGKTLTKVKNLKQIKGLQTTFADIREDEEPTKAELNKKDSVATISNKLQKLTAKMKDIAGSHKRAKKANATNDMEKYVEQLKKMTKEKKQLEKSL